MHRVYMPGTNVTRTLQRNSVEALYVCMYVYIYCVYMSGTNVTRTLQRTSVEAVAGVIAGTKVCMYICVYVCMYGIYMSGTDAATF